MKVTLFLDSYGNRRFDEVNDREKIRKRCHAVSIYYNNATLFRFLRNDNGRSEMMHNNKGCHAVSIYCCNTKRKVIL